MATANSYENEVNENYSITSKTRTTRTSTSRPQSTTPMTTLTSTIAWRTCTGSARTAHWFHSCDCLTLHIPCLKSWALSYLHPWSSTWRTFFDSPSPLSTFTSSSCLSPSSSSTSSRSLSSSTRSAWQTTCAAPLQKVVRTPWTPSPLSQVMSPSSLPSTSSTTHQYPLPQYPVLGPRRGWRDTRRDGHSGTPRTSRILRTRRHVSQSDVVCNVRWIRATWRRENGRPIRATWCHAKRDWGSQHFFWRHPNWAHSRSIRETWWA